MIIFCPEEFISQVSGKGMQWLERGFIKFFVSETGKKMTIANETWETFRFKIIKDSPEQEEALNLIASFRSIFLPEELFLDDNHREKPSNGEHSKLVMIEKTKELIKRNYADIEIVITNNSNEYNDCSKNIPCMDVEEFYIHCTTIQKYRAILEKYWRMIEYKKAIGED